MTDLAFDQPDPNARHPRQIPPAVLAKLGEALAQHDGLLAAGRRGIVDAVDLSQLVAGMDFDRRASRQWNRVCALADGFATVLDLDRMELLKLADDELRRP
jgi:hypothetical protein